MREFLRLLLPHDQLSEMLGRLARELATTDSDIDRRGGAMFFSSSDREVDVFLGHYSHSFRL